MLIKSKYLEKNTTLSVLKFLRGQSPLIFSCRCNPESVLVELLCLSTSLNNSRMNYTSIFKSNNLKFFFLT